MKFEIVEEPGGDLPPAEDRAVALTREKDEIADPLGGLRAGTARLADAMRSEAAHIGECVAEVTQLAAQARGTWSARYGRATADPPANFRAARFGGSSNG